jgi:hypothetical protein
MLEYMYLGWLTGQVRPAGQKMGWGFCWDLGQKPKFRVLRWVR